jgi:hypothetical protein
MKLFQTLTLFLISTCLISACGKSTTSVNDSELARIQLAKSDASELQNFNPIGAQLIDENLNGNFSKIFGGSDAASVQKYFNDRVHHFVDSTMISLWANGEKLEMTNNDSSPKAAPTPDVTNQIQALNITTPIWLEGLANNLNIELKDGDGTMISVDSSRAGIIELGAAYLPTFQSSSGRTYTIPVEARQAILMHEARHSDCTGGFSGAQLAIFKTVKDTDDLDTKFPLMTCGHLHQKCLDGDFKGIEACDGEAFGAYTMGAVYALAGSYSSTDPVAVEILKANFVDYLSRVQGGIDMTAVLTGKTPITPDMSSDGFHP